MNLQYLQDNNGNTVAVVVPIEEWNKFPERYSDVEDLPQWQKNIVDQRLDFIKNHPEQLLPVEDLLKELDLDDAL